VTASAASCCPSSVQRTVKVHIITLLVPVNRHRSRCVVVIRVDL